MRPRLRSTMGALVLLLAACAPATTPAPIPTDTPAPTGYANPQLLVETEWLAQHLSDTDLRLVDLRAADKYQEGHIPGAVSLSLGEVTINEPIRGMTAPPQQFAQAMGSLGISNDTQVVIYDDFSGLIDARLFWLLEYYGHSKVSLLNGGYPKWTAESRETTQVAPRITAATFIASPDPGKLATKQYILDNLNNPNVVVVDARSPAEYAGEEAGAARGGHIPGAVNINWVLGVTGAPAVFKSAQELREAYAQVAHGKEAITYCQTGVRAAHDYFVLRLLGYDKVRNYDGSWQEWGNDSTTPIEK